MSVTENEILEDWSRACWRSVVENLFGGPCTAGTAPSATGLELRK